MATIISGAEFDGQAAPVIVGWAEFDALAPAQAAASVVVSWAEFDTLAPPASAGVIVSFIDFDALRPRPIVVSQIEFDTLAPASAQGDSVSGARRVARTSVSTVKSSPPAPVSNYHSRAYEQEEAERAAELADEEAVLTFLMELSLV